MKANILLLALVFFNLGLHAQDITGAWESYTTGPNGQRIHSVVIFADGYQVLASYDADTGAFIHTNGGTWKLEDNIMTEKVEFFSDAEEPIGQEVSFEVAITEDSIQIVGSDQKLTRLDDGSPGALQGAWLMSGRVRDGETQSRNTDQPRKTMKILSGTRFQWIAYNTETKEFKGTGGGSYTTIDGKYTENIEFFSRDNSKVGMSLEFDYELIDGHWHHIGFSSKGDPKHEIWTVRD